MVHVRFGIEVEAFIYPKSPIDIQANESQYNAVFRSVHQALARAGLPAHDIDQSLNQSSSSIEVKDEPQPYTRWRAKSEMLDVQGLPGGSLPDPRTPVELVSPVLKCDRNGAIAVVSALKVLHEHFHVRVNKCCGLHVHVSLDVPFTIQMLVNLALILVGFSDAIATLFPKSRVENQFCVDIAQNKNFKDMPLQQKLIKIQSVADVNALAMLLNPNRCSSWNFLNLTTYSPHIKTIEARLHDATTDPSEILSWARFVCTLISFACTTPLAKITSMLEYAEDESYSVIHLAQDIGFPGWDAWRHRKFFFSSDDSPRARAHYQSVALHQKRPAGLHVGSGDRKPDRNPACYVPIDKRPLAQRRPDLFKDVKIPKSPPPDYWGHSERFVDMLGRYDEENQNLIDDEDRQLNLFGNYFSTNLPEEIGHRRRFLRPGMQYKEPDSWLSQLQDGDSQDEQRQRDLNSILEGDGMTDAEFFTLVDEENKQYCNGKITLPIDDN